LEQLPLCWIALRLAVDGIAAAGGTGFPVTAPLPRMV